MEFDLITTTQISKNTINNTDLIYLFKHNPLLIKCIVNKQIEFKYALLNQLTPLQLDTVNFTYLTRLNNRADFNLFSSDKSNLFTFYIFKSSNDSTSNFTTSKLDLKLINSSLDSNLSSILFESSKSGQSPILLIGSNDGCVYWQNLNNIDCSKPLNDSILLNASSPIIYIQSFRYNHSEKQLFDALFRSNLTTNDVKNESLINDNCLFIITKSSRIYLFAYTTDYIYKSCILPHYIDKCIKYVNSKKSYLIYSNLSDKNVYSIDLEHFLKDKPIKPIIIKRNLLVKKFEFIPSDNSLFALANSGKKVKLKIDQEDYDNYNNNENKNIDKHLIKSYLNKICGMSNKIVKSQMKLDKLNLALKQLNYLQQIKFNDSNLVFFEVEIKFTKSYSLEFKLTNKLVSLEDNLNHSSYFLYTLIQMNGLTTNKQSSNWISKSDNLTALKPNMTQMITFDLSDEIVNNHQLPTKIVNYLVFDVNNFLTNLSNFDCFKNEENFNEFSICLYNHSFDLSDYFENGNLIIDASKLNKQFSTSIAFNLIRNSLNRLNCEDKLEVIWNGFCFENLKSNDLKYLIDSNVSILNLNSSILPNINLNLNNNNNGCSKLAIHCSKILNDSTFAQNIANLIYLKNKYLLPLFKNVKSSLKISQDHSAFLRVRPILFKL
jgi:hypothetical protein